MIFATAHIRKSLPKVQKNGSLIHLLKTMGFVDLTNYLGMSKAEMVRTRKAVLLFSM